MGGGQPLDAARPSGREPLDVRTSSFFLFIFLATTPQSFSQNSQSPIPADGVLDGELEEWVQAEEWGRLVMYLSSLESRTINQEYLLGVSLARLERLGDAESVLAAGAEQAPADPRFPLGLAGVEFKRRRLLKAEEWLHVARERGADSDYVNEFLGTIYYLRENLEATLKYWNRLNKPELSGIHYEPTPSLDPFLLDRFFTFARNETLTLKNFRATRQRLEAARIFSRTRFQLTPVKENKFELSFLSTPRMGINHGRRAALFTLAKELPFETVRLDLYNPWAKATVWESSYRWDSTRQRFVSRWGRRLMRAPQWGYWILLDVRSELWDLNPEFATVEPADFDFEKVGGSIGVEYSDRNDWQLSSQFHLGWREFGRLDTDTRRRYHDGALLRYETEIRYSLWRRPEEDLEVEVFAKGGLGSVPADDEGLFPIIEGGVSFHSFLDRSEHDWELTADFRAGRIGEGAPFDQLFMLGIDQDSHLWLRGHPVTENGRKGNAPLGNQYLLLSLGLMRPLQENGLFSLEIGPFLDSGRIEDGLGLLAQEDWLVDAGIQLNLRLLGSFLFQFSYGRDLKTGQDLFRILPRSRLP